MHSKSVQDTSQHVRISSATLFGPVSDSLGVFLTTTPTLIMADENDLVTFDTSVGSFTVELYRKHAPKVRSRALVFVAD